MRDHVGAVLGDRTALGGPTSEGRRGLARFTGIGLRFGKPIGPGRIVDWLPRRKGNSGSGQGGTADG
jgi:hypothetical protein